MDNYSAFPLARLVGRLRALSEASTPPVAKKKWVSAGGVVIMSKDRPDKVCVIKPRNNYGPWAFPKGRVDKGESLKEAALREIEEETGLTAKIIPTTTQGYIGRGTGSFSVTHFFLMVRTGGTPTPNEESEEIRFVTWDRAKQLFKQSGNKRDGAIADQAVATLKGLGIIKDDVPKS